jgi:Cyclic nucleotide-binding domain
MNADPLDSLTAAAQRSHAEAVFQASSAVVGDGDSVGGARLHSPNRSPEADAFAESLLARSARLRLPALFERPRPEAVYQVRDRGGVSVVMLETRALSEHELAAVLRFRLAQYLAVGFADAQAVFESGLEHEPLSSVSPSDFHVLAGSAHDGEILCYLAVRGSAPTWPGQRMRSRARRAFPVEEMHGKGIYDRLAVLPDLPVAKVREIGRFVKNQRLHSRDELGLRAPVEVLLALIRGILGPLRSQVDALVGEVEEGVVKRNLEFFNIPIVLIRGTVSYEAPSWFIGHTGRTFYPFALSVADVAARSLPRVAAIEQTLELPGRKAMLELLALKRTAAPQPSRLEPPEGLPPLASAEVPHADTPTPIRRQMRERGELLRKVAPFNRLTTAEATVLRTFMSTRRQREGDVIIRKGEHGEGLFVVEEGEAEVLAHGPDGRQSTLGRLGPGSCFGEIALALGVSRSATVVARTPMTLLQLTAADYRRYVTTIGELDRVFLTLAVNQLASREGTIRA